jgi:predicted dehydrogenase
MRIAFVGGPGHHYLRRLLTDDHQVAWAPDPHDLAASEAFAARLPNPTRFDDTPTMLRSFRPDVVNVGVVYGHAGDAIATCLEHDVPVVADKPIAATWPQFNRLVKLCDGTKRTLVSEFDFRSRSEYRSARQAVAAGLVGRIGLIVAQKSYRWGTRPAWYANRADYGSTLLWVASHAIDLIRFVTASEITCLFARQSNVTRGKEWGTCEDVATATFSLGDGGASAVVHADFLRPINAPTHGDDRFRLIGDKGLIEVINGRCTLTTNEVPPTDITDQATSKGPEQEMLTAALAGGNEFFSTDESLRTAELLLKTRDIADASA